MSYALHFGTSLYAAALAASATQDLLPAIVHGWERHSSSDSPALVARFDELRAAMDAGTYRDVRSVVVVRDGQLLVEQYYNGATRGELHNPRSVGKTFASALTGLALRDGHVHSLDQTLGEFYDLEEFEHPSPKKDAVTLRDLLMMTSGFDGFDFVGGNPGNEDNMYARPDWVRWALSLPMAANREPGERWFYFTAGVVVLGDILCNRVPGGLEVYAERELFEPLGIDEYRWQYTPQRVPSTAGGLAMAPLDFAKFGQLYKNAGRWHGRQVLPEEWVAESLAYLNETTIEGCGYGYLWWRRVISIGGRELSAAYCSGNGGNVIYVFDDLPLVVVITASAYNQPYMHTQVAEILEAHVLPAVLELE